MKILGVIMVMLLFSPRQTPTSYRHNDTYKSGAVSVQASDRSHNLMVAAETALAQTNNSGVDANARLAISIWNDLNAMCRGGHGDRPETEYACCVRSKVDSLLNNMGYCYRMGDVWRRCQPRDKRARTVTLTDCVR
jgi:hypothetical protein